MRKPISFRSFLNRKTALVVGAGAAVVALSGTAAFAYWTTTGAGTGSATTGTSHSVTVAQVGTISALTPGSPAQPVNFTERGWLSPKAKVLSGNTARGRPVLRSSVLTVPERSSR